MAVAAGAPAAAQSLADVARKEAERRQATQAPTRTYTNGSLTPDFTTPPQPAPAAPGEGVQTGAEGKAESALAADAPGAAPGADQEGVTPRDEQEPQPSHDKGEDFWRARANRIRARLNQQNAEIAALQKQVSSFPPGSASPEHSIAVRALSKAQDDLVSLNDEWLRFERQARERNVPDAWIR